MRLAYFDCFAGISGDMALGALVDAGADFDALKQELDKLHLHEFEISAENVTKRGISATDVTVALQDHKHGHGRHLAEIKRIIEESALSDTVKSRSVSIFQRLGEAEAKIHSKDVEEIHFHEVGAVDAIVDIVGACICLELLDIDRVLASPVPTFHGTVEIAHGKFPLPAPATAELLKDVPWRELGIEGEIVTPTGAAILAELSESFGPMPAMSVKSIGYGAGKKDFGMPNVLRVMIGETSPQPLLRPSSGCTPDKRGSSAEVCHEVAVMETNVDDVSPQVYEVLMERLFTAGALDVYLTPIQMKKNRPAVLVSVMCAPEHTSAMSEILFEETSTIGVRIDLRQRICLPREIVSVDTKFGSINVKVARRGGDIINAQPEYEDCKAAAAAHSVPVKLVRDTTLAAFYSQ